MTANAAAFTGSIPAFYDAGLGPVMFAGYAGDIARRAAAIGGAKVLELAAGTGIVTARLREALPASASLTATDLNAAMLEIAERKLAGKGVAFRTADAMALPFEDQTFDLIVCQFGVMFFPDKAQSFREARRVLKTGGHYLFNAWGPLSGNAFAGVVDDLGRELSPAAPPQFYRTPFGYADRGVIAADLKAADLREVSFERVRLEGRVDDWARFAGGLVNGNPFGAELASAAGVAADDVVATLAERLQKKFGRAPATIPLEANVIVARRN